MKRAVIVFTLACTAAGVFAADKQQVYKWTDANGVLHFSDAPPPSDTKNVQALRLSGGTTQAAVTASSQANPAAPAATATAAAAATAPVPPPDDATLCKQSRSNLELLQSKTTVGIAGTDGKALVLDDKARESQIANAKLAIARFCK